MPLAHLKPVGRDPVEPTNLFLLGRQEISKAQGPKRASHPALG